MKKITKEKFIEMYSDHTITDMARKLKVSRTTINNWVIKFDLPLKRPRLIKD